MLKFGINWRTGLLLVAVAIVIGSMVYAHYLSNKLAEIERSRVEIWAEALKTQSSDTNGTNLNLAIKIVSENKDIAIIETDEQDSITPNYKNLDTNKIKEDPFYLQKKLAEFKKLHPPYILQISQSPPVSNHYYYGESRLQQELRYYPIVQLLIIGLFIVVAIIAQQSNFKSVQNGLWVGMAKETAHQLGTPLTSLQGWLELLKAIPENKKITPEMEKDIDRLLLITDRFGKIGSTPQLEEKNIVLQTKSIVDYMRKRAGGQVQIRCTSSEKEIMAHISPPLFDWVIENLLKNALDAIERKGAIHVSISSQGAQVIIDVSDTGKGIAATQIKKIFNPGFTTKKRGWGLGLALSKRIVEEYHQGEISVKYSEPNVETTFRIVLQGKNND
ncbi:MAG: HAMP domain-containing histidine kinase [Chitinophagaceae bacterium]|nr:HAMP domain-containing histidine kinase [Chitinophagaceae bacterium]